MKLYKKFIFILLMISKNKLVYLHYNMFCLSANRLTTMHDFGYVALNMKYVNPEDSGTYTCRAINELGEAVTSSTLFVQCKLHSFPHTKIYL